MSLDDELTQSLDQGVREGLARVLDVLLPRTEQLPSGREVAVHEEWIDRVLAASPRPFRALNDLGEHASNREGCTLPEIRDWAGDQFEEVLFALTAAYYMSPVVMRALGYPGQTRRPVSEATPDELCSEDLIAPVVQRGPVYVPTPDPPQP